MPSLVETRSLDPVRFQILFLICMGCLVLLVAGLAWRQLVQGSTFREQELFQKQRQILMPGPRGEILDRAGRVLVANRPRFSAVVYLNELRPEFRQEFVRRLEVALEEEPRPDRPRIAIAARAAVLQRYLDQITALTGIPANVSTPVLERHFSQNLLLPFPLINDLDLVSYARLIEQLPVTSPIQILTDGVRHYPYGSLASHTLGHLTAHDELLGESLLPGQSVVTFRLRGRRGASGVERALDEVLTGQTGGEVWVVDPSGFQFSRVAHRPPVKGQDVVLALDADLQQAAEHGLRGLTGAVVAIDIQTGEVLALASAPDYDLNDFTPFLRHDASARITERGAWYHRAVQGLYPPGSTFKLITTVAGLRSGHIKPNASSYCSGSFRVGERTFHCHNRRGHGHVDLPSAIEKSCNVFFYEHGLEIGVDLLAAEARRFGFDQRTGIELPNESGRMIVPDPAWKRQREGMGWFPGDTANLSIGQGYLLVTPLQMATSTASFARNETRTRPTLLARPATSPGAVAGNAQALPPALHRLIVEGMERSSLQGTGKFVNLPNLRIASKTGTAQVFPRGQALTLAWIIAYAPIENPRIAVAVVIEGTDPADPAAGGTTAAPIARHLFQTWQQTRR